MTLINVSSTQLAGREITSHVRDGETKGGAVANMPGQTIYRLSTHLSASLVALKIHIGHDVISVD